MSFVQFARAHGVEIDPAKLYPSQKIRRCGTTEKPRSGNGAYFWDGERGWVFDWSGEAKVNWYNDPNAQPWTQAEKDAWKAKRQAQRAQQEQGYQRAAQQAAEMLRSATPGEHSYLHSKGFPLAQGLVAQDGALLVPMRHHQTNALQGVQVIRWLEDERRHEKKMQPYGMKAAGAVLRMGPPKAVETVLVEGYATGLTVLEALRGIGIHAVVLVTFSAHNLTQVAQAVGGKAYIFADHDQSGTGQKAAEATGLPWCMSPVEGEDANDLHQRAGLLAVRQLLMRVRLQRKG
ncbi:MULTISPECIES: hypothetical protein [Giesbergeria]|uniref:Toprim domain-containing protein n=1 Tax=Giesbergeria sinuosa TaxID=80883 RepID=A0ABV9QES8_9BURK